MPTWIEPLQVVLMIVLAWLGLVGWKLFLLARPWK